MNTTARDMAHTQLTVPSTDRSSNNEIGENNNVATQLVDDGGDLKQQIEDEEGESTPSLLGSMGHLVWTGTSFERQKPSRVPTRIVSLRVLSEEQAKLTACDVTTSCVARVPAFMDTCAQTCVTDPSLLGHLCIGEEDLIPTNHKIVAVTKDPLHIKGILLVEISLDERSTNQSVYVTDSVRGLFLTMGAQMDLGILPLSYPGCFSAMGGGHVGGVGDRGVKGGGASGASRSPSPPSPAPIILQF